MLGEAARRTKTAAELPRRLLFLYVRRAARSTPRGLGLFQRAADFVEFRAEAGAEGGQRRDQEDRDQRSDQRVFDGGRAGLVVDESLEVLRHAVTPDSVDILEPSPTSKAFR
jgi:hypothetical protein